MSSYLDNTSGADETPVNSNASFSRENTAFSLRGITVNDTRSESFPVINSSIVNEDPAPMNSVLVNQADKESGIQHETPESKDSKFHKVLKEGSSTFSNSVGDILKQCYLDSDNKPLRLPQGAILPPPLFPTVFGSTIFNPLLLRNPSVNDTANIFRHPFGMIARDAPFRFSAYLSQLPTQSFYHYGGQGLNRVPSTTGTFFNITNEEAGMNAATKDCVK